MVFGGRAVPTVLAVNEREPGEAASWRGCGRDENRPKVGTARADVKNEPSKPECDVESARCIFVPYRNIQRPFALPPSIRKNRTTGQAAGLASESEPAAAPNKTGMSFRFMVVLLATVRPIKDSDFARRTASNQLGALGAD